MLVIRHEQIDALYVAKKRDFERSLLIYLKDTCSDLCADRDEAELRDLVQSSVSGAERLGHITEEAIRRFAVCALKHGIHFISDTPWARSIDNDNLLPPEEKLKRFEQHPPEIGGTK